MVSSYSPLLKMIHVSLFKRRQRANEDSEVEEGIK